MLLFYFSSKVKKKKKDVQRIIIIAVFDWVLVLERYPKKIQRSETESNPLLPLMFSLKRGFPFYDLQLLLSHKVPRAHAES